MVRATAVGGQMTLEHGEWGEHTNRCMVLDYICDICNNRSIEQYLQMCVKDVLKCYG